MSPVPAKPPALVALSAEHWPPLFPPDLRRRLDRLVRLEGPVDRFDLDRLAEVEVLITGWGCPAVDRHVLEAAPKLRAVLHAAGSVKGHLSREVWERGIVVSSAVDANAVPVAEFTLGAILLAGKGAFDLRERYRRERTFELGHIHPGIGNHGRTVGLIGASRVGRQVLELLRPFGFRVQVHDPYAADLDVPLVDLSTLLRTSDIVSVHAPLTAETQQLLGSAELALLRDGTTLINTARGQVVDTDALIGELISGRISAVLDVTEPEPLPSDSVLFTLPNAFVTPHIAGSHGNELARLGGCVTAELERFLAGEPLHFGISATDLDRAA
ncbi:phosphoglycerate dehydrogenase-like enzyme [Kribbella aluminosa]|uniref:Phosphoglycerate dehydrogenase-like enzyme n=1 Tax=Kribbella aluminosa TaxID=416017 RepID=A0ABS4UW20_9ACTN|nr:hydroxyacid dehydrogenase [Kribbella aluminosa]MBP2355816.1 phosphoglycerate dehydrogenase-like enzyme [Kribbella aluminosa]